MIIIQIAGGLGNQMQQYALYRKLLSLGKEVKLDISWFSEEVQKKMLAPREFELPLFIYGPFASLSSCSINAPIGALSTIFCFTERMNSDPCP